MDANERVCRWLKIPWHEVVAEQPYELDRVSVGSLLGCSCGLVFHRTNMPAHIAASNPDFSADPVGLLREIMKWPDREEFLLSLDAEAFISNDLRRTFVDIMVSIINKYILTPGPLLDAVDKWREEHDTETSPTVK